MSRTRVAVLLMLLALFLVGGAATEWVAWQGRPGFPAMVDLLAGWALAWSGLIAWARVPASRVGPLLAAAALAWFGGTWIAMSSTIARSPVGAVAELLIQLSAGFLVHALVTWPSGRARTARQRLLVVGAYVAAISPLFWASWPAMLAGGAVLAGDLCLDHAAVLPARRPAHRPVLAAGLLLAAALPLGGWVAAQLRHLGVTVLSDRGTIWAIVVIVVAATLAAALVAQERRRERVADLAVQLGDEPRADVIDGLRRSLDRDPGAAPDVAMEEALVRAAALVERNRSLQGILAGQVEDLEASRRRLLEVGDDERRELEQALRTGAAARLAGLEASVRVLADGGSETHLGRAVVLLAQARSELDDLARGLDPGGLGGRSLDPALQDLVTHSPIPVEVQLAAAAPPMRAVSTALYFVASEALANVIRHAQATCAWLRLHRAGDRFVLIVEDDGVGGADVTRGTGLRGLQDRLEALGGTLVVGERPGGGTRLTATLPATSAAAVTGMVTP